MLHACRKNKSLEPSIGRGPDLHLDMCRGEAIISGPFVRGNAESLYNLFKLKAFVTYNNTLLHNVVIMAPSDVLLKIAKAYLNPSLRWMAIA
jgi:hypothetical protein